MYVSPDYPTAGSFTANWSYQNPDQNNQQFYYGGYNTFNGIGDPNSRINQTSFNQNPYQNNQYGYQNNQPVNQTPVPQVQVQPFSSYGGSGVQMNQNPQTPTIMPTLNTAMTFNQPTPVNNNVNPYQNNQPLPTFAQPVQQTNPYAAMFNSQIPTFDRRTECWGNQYVQPQPLPMPNIDWNKPVQQPFVNPMQQNFQCPFNQPNQTFQENWVDTFKRNIAASI